ncbi:MAG: hypothetical protein KUG82_05090 [Pseudomonadales bacterium]|nr:hypothetical protein [Pseudomonadales bacterium]
MINKVVSKLAIRLIATIFLLGSMLGSAVAVEQFASLSGRAPIGPFSKNISFTHKFLVQSGSWCQKDLPVKVELHSNDSKNLSYRAISHVTYFRLKDQHFRKIAGKLGKKCKANGVKVKRIHFSFYIMGKKQEFGGMKSYRGSVVGWSEIKNKKFMQFSFVDAPAGEKGPSTISLDKELKKTFKRFDIQTICPVIRSWADSLRAKGLNPSAPTSSKDKSLVYRLYADDIFTKYFTTSLVEASKSQKSNFNGFVRFCVNSGSSKQGWINGRPILPSSYSFLSLQRDETEKLAVASARNFGFAMQQRLSKGELFKGSFSEFILDLRKLNSEAFWQDEFNAINQTVSNKSGRIVKRLMAEKLKNIGSGELSFAQLISYREFEDTIRLARDTPNVEVDQEMYNKVHIQHQAIATGLFEKSSKDLLALERNFSGLEKSKSSLQEIGTHLHFYQDLGVYSNVKGRLWQERKQLLTDMKKKIFERIKGVKSKRNLALFQSRYFFDKEITANENSDLYAAFVAAEKHLVAVKREEDIKYFMETYYTPFEISNLTESGKFNTTNTIPAPNENTIFKVFFRVVDNHWKARGYGHFIRNKTTLSMPVKALGFSMRSDTSVTKLKVKSCVRVDHKSFRCDYDFEYRVRPVHENVALNEFSNKISFLTEGVMAKYEVGRQTQMSHTFTFTENGWQSQDFGDFYRKDNARMDRISDAWQAARPKYKTCLSYKGLSFSCW